MFSNRLMQQSLRGFAAAPKNPSLLRTSVFRAAVGNVPQIRSAATAATDSKAIPGQESAILAKQRLARPISPHLTIYRPQISWIGSGLHRITGSLMAGGLYIFATAYLVSPLLGWHLDSTSLAAAFGSLPIAVKASVKFFTSLMFSYHAASGTRHLWWDMCKGLTNKKIIRSGWAAIGFAVAAASYMTFF
ncbi:succinate dehydrogenase cytochrome b560 subunit [Ascosphaera apis ARSEF 7405]|uniref:Succinate dehydrogenase cytochrome b560 subunit n=1 Tax=Ascosphaera apis ARSEF 7405 TaxID=392613 RepID=A0A168DVH8_9EURO|nr:succinate dehydrogenase cytochrome b560 subunit [Ascosphaera apis ARSEF 7405]